MKITKLVKQDKRDRISVFIDGKYNFSVSTWQVASLGLRLERELSAEELKGLKEATEFGKVYDRTISLIASRPRSRDEIVTYLKRKTQNNNVVEQVLAQLGGRGYINDHKFAEFWVENRRLHKLISTRILRLELRQKRVDPEIIDQVLSKDETDEVEVIKKLIAKKRNRYPDELKLKAYLASKGFSYSSINQALSEDD